MSDFKIGDTVGLNKKMNLHLFPSDHLEIKGFKNGMILVDREISIRPQEIKLIKSGDLKMSYETSNRKKLYDAIKKTGFQAIDLSVASGHEKNYFSAAASESRFLNRGDLSDKRLNTIITDLSYAERVLSGNKAIEKSDNESIDDLKSEYEISNEFVNSIENFEIKDQNGEKMELDTKENKTLTLEPKYNEVNYNKLPEFKHKNKEIKNDGGLFKKLLSVLILSIFATVVFLYIINL